MVELMSGESLELLQNLSHEISPIQVSKSSDFDYG